jgi:hypothetical protein
LRSAWAIQEKPCLRKEKERDEEGGRREGEKRRKIAGGVAQVLGSPAYFCLASQGLEYKAQYCQKKKRKKEEKKLIFKPAQ